MKNKILIIGSKGFIGSYFFRNLKSKGYSVKGISRSELNSLANSKIEFEKYLKKFKPSLVIYNSALAHQSKYKVLTRFSYLYKINIETPKKIARYLVNYKNCRMIFISTVGVHGSHTMKGQKINEDSPFCPENAYSLSKLIAEIELKKIFASNNSLLTIIRPCLVYGKNPPGNLKSLLKIIDLSIPLPFRDIQNKRSILSINTLFLAILQIINNPESSGNKTYVIADKETISIMSLIKKIGIARNKKILLFSISKKLLKFIYLLPIINKPFKQLTQDFVVDPQKIYKELKFKPIKKQEIDIQKYLSKD